MAGPVPQFENPTTGATYRLIQTGEAWRITKSVSVNDDDSVRLTHLRGTRGSGIAERGAIAALVRGESVRGGSADPQATFAAAVLTDLEHTADLLAALARDAQQAYDDGAPGFRPQSGVLRDRRDRAMQTLTDHMLAMARAWRGSSLQASPLPEWLEAALTELPG